MNIFELAPATRLRIRQELANSTLTVGEIVEVLVIEALNARELKERHRIETARVVREFGFNL